jgi:glycosyltransferase involved in cell wall biosynthesis
MALSTAIIIPCRNHGQYVGDAVASALTQTLAASEIIVIDDASEEPSRAACAVLASDRVRVLRNEKNLGLSASRNRAVREARSEAILPLDADDRLDPDFLRLTVPVLESAQDIGWVYTDCTLFGAQDGFLEFPDYDPILLLAHDLCLAPSLFRKRDWERAGGYDESFRIGQEDWDFWVTLAEKGLRGTHVPRRLYYYRQHSASMRSRSHQDIDVSAQKLWNKHKDFYKRNAEAIWRYYVGRFYGGRPDPFRSTSRAGLMRRIKGRFCRWFGGCK